MGIAFLTGRGIEPVVEEIVGHLEAS